MEQKFNFEFSVAELNIVLRGLSELPAKESYGLINRIYESVEKFNSEQAPPAPPAKMKVVKEN